MWSLSVPQASADPLSSSCTGLHGVPVCTYVLTYGSPEPWKPTGTCLRSHSMQKQGDRLLLPVQWLFPLYPPVSNGFHSKYISLTNPSSHLTHFSRVKGCWVSLGAPSGSPSTPNMTLLCFLILVYSLSRGLKLSEGREVVGRYCQSNDSLLAQWRCEKFLKNYYIYTLRKCVWVWQRREQPCSAGCFRGIGKENNSKPGRSLACLTKSKGKKGLPAPSFTDRLLEARGGHSQCYSISSPAWNLVQADKIGDKGKTPKDSISLSSYITLSMLLPGSSQS